MYSLIGMFLIFTAIVFGITTLSDMDLKEKVTMFISFEIFLITIMVGAFLLTK